ncbi:MAG: hypothetical protein JXR30_01635 [Alphaproteobacteria bacterium]|nr:hypothetical protein [Alphaproteobacteria bacterium]
MKKLSLILVGAVLVLGGCSSSNSEKNCTCTKMQCNHGGTAGIKIKNKKKMRNGNAGVRIENKEKGGSAGIKIIKK